MIYFPFTVDTLKEISRSICKLDKGQADTGTGFFLRAKFKDKHIYLLITAQHFIPSPLVEVRKEIEIIADNGNLKQKIILNNNERKILCFLDKDITAIEILDNDIIRHKVKFLKYDKNCKKDFYKNYLGMIAYTFPQPNDEGLKCYFGKILAVGMPKHYEFAHNLQTQKGSSGSPIFVFKQNLKKSSPKPRVIGVHTSCDPKSKLNIGTFINVLIEQLKNGIDNLIYEKKFIVPENTEVIAPSGTNLIINYLSTSNNSSITLTGDGCITLGGNP